ncbi:MULTISPECIES: integron integrase [Pseudoalteromonas]|uniref:Integrase n=1 Tax=Pseudoalteromonas amylolytica TaxID=1859457 RepID=A0A1S1MU64_9GAMM|nr:MULTISPECIES: integron integrase [Pseudoalteromonas]OHU87012.1 integrase [Pseudoalteromonas sp. JW3]OHU88279.1 integrase [Pseudoalteromonas amylolytica]
MNKSPFLESVRVELRTRRYSLKTEKAYLHWIKRFILFNDKRHPEGMGNVEIERFLNHLACNRLVSAATQNLALCAIIFLYRYIIKQEIKGLNYASSQVEKALPTVLTHDEATEIINHLQGKYALIANMLYGSGLRINEALSLRVKDLDFNQGTIFVFRGKGKKDRYTLLPKSLHLPLQQQIEKVKQLHKRDLNEGFGMASLPPSLVRKYKHAVKDFAWQYLFPSSTRCVHPHDNYICRHHLHETTFRKALRVALLKTDICKRVKAHTFRHSFATELLQSGSDIRTVQTLLGHEDVKTTQIYTHVIGDTFAYTNSPIDK